MPSQSCSGHRDSSRILPMLGQDFVLKIPATLPYGGEFTGPEAFAKFFAGTPGGAEVWESFNVHVDQVSPPTRRPART
jgi:hypothetical protein